MKKLALFICAVVLIFTSCNNDDNTTAISVNSISIEPNSVTLVKNQTFTLQAIIVPENAANKEIEWLSLNPLVASVDESGVVTALSPGETTITVTTKDGNKTANCNVIVVSEIISVTGISIEPATLTLSLDSTYTLIANVEPANTTNKSVIWNSTDASIVSVDNNGTITAHAPGETTITATTVDGNHTANCVVTVTSTTRPKLAIEYVAEYNVNTNGDGFATSHDNDKSGYFTWNEAKNLFDGSVPELQGYHYPTIEELTGIISHAGYITYSPSRPTNYTGIQEKITVNGNTKTYFADYNNATPNISYGIKFMNADNELRCAYRYEPIGLYESANNLTGHFKVTVRYLGPNFTGSINDISNENYWDTNNQEDIVRIFPAVGFIDQSGALQSRGSSGRYSSITESKPTSNYQMVFGTATAFRDSALTKLHGFCVRPFSDN